MLALVLALACATPTATAVGTVDARVDHAGAVGEDDGIDSTDPVSCFSADGKLYVAWQDDRLGALGTWFNASEDGGVTFMDEDVQLNYGAGAATAPAIACDGDRVYVAWEDTRSGDFGYPGVYFNRSDNAGRTWLGLDVQVNEDPDGQHPAIRPAVSAAGSTVYVAWADSRDGAYDIRVRASTDGGGSWSPSARADTDLPGVAYSAAPAVVADPEGNVLLAWEDRRDGGGDVYANWGDDFAASFSAADARIDLGDEPGSAESSGPRLELSETLACVAWQDERTGEATRAALAAVSPDRGHSWSAAAALRGEGAALADAAAPAIAMSEGTCHVAWQDDRDGGYDVFHRAIRAGAGGVEWAGEESRLDTSVAGKSHSSRPVIHARGGTVLVGWEDRRHDSHDEGFDDLYYNASTDGGASWLADDVRVNSGEPGAAFAVDLGLFSDGDHVVAAWADGRYGSSDIYAMRRPLGEPSKWYPPAESVDGP